jgi:hypothetical protein
MDRITARITGITAKELMTQDRSPFILPILAVILSILSTLSFTPR